MGSTDNSATANVAKNLQSKSSASATPPASGLSAPVGTGAENRPDDVFKVSSALAANGLMAALQSHADSRLYSGIIGAQERMDSSLKRDGLIKPGDPTEGTFSRLAGQAARAKQAVSARLKNLASQAGVALGALMSDASSTRHARESGNPDLNPLEKMDPGLCRDDGLRGDSSLRAMMRSRSRCVSMAKTR